MVNPSGLEISAAICVWTGGLILVLDRATHPPPSLIASIAVASIVMVLMRGLSPLWLAVIAATLAVLGFRSLPALIRLRTVRVAAGAVTFTGVVAVVYILLAHALSVSPLGQPVPAGTSEWASWSWRWGVPDRWSASSSALSARAPTPPYAVIGLWLSVVSAIVVLGSWPVSGVMRPSSSGSP